MSNNLEKMWDNIGIIYILFFLSKNPIEIQKPTMLAHLLILSNLSVEIKNIYSSFCITKSRGGRTPKQPKQHIHLIKSWPY